MAAAILKMTINIQARVTLSADDNRFSNRFKIRVIFVFPLFN